MGDFPELSKMKVGEGDDLTSLYREVLIDTPVGIYFIRFLEQSIESLGDNKLMSDVHNVFKEMKPENIRNSLKKMWLEDFVEFCRENLNPTSTEMMVDLLNTEADFKSI